MFSVYLASSGTSEWLGLVVALAVVGGAAGLLGTKSRRLVVALMVAGLLAYAGTAYAVPYIYCDPLWHWLGWC